MTKSEVKKRIRILLDNIYYDSYQLAENFSSEILDEVVNYIMNNNYNTLECMTREFITEAMLWCYMCKMQ